MKLRLSGHSRSRHTCSASSGTQNERAWRRFYILPETTIEIEFNSAENYRNIHNDEEKWRKAPFRIHIPLPAKKRDEVE